MSKEVGWGGVFRIYPLHNFCKGARLPLSIWIISIVLFCCSDIKANEMTALVASIITTGFPSIIGFILTGHALIIGFSGSDFLLTLAKTKPNYKFSYFQKVNSTLSVVTGILICTLIAGGVSSIVLKYNLNWPFEKGCDLFNSLVFAFVLFCFYYSLFSLLDIVINIFNLGQISNKVAQGKIKTLEAEEKVTDTTNKVETFWSLFKNLISLNDIFK